MTSADPIAELLVNHRAPTEARLRERPPVPLAPGEVRVQVEHFALTANNITYAAFGEAMHYWQFFPTGEAGWGLVPVWGFGRVIESRHPEVDVGQRLYGYWPMASQATLQPVRVRADSLMDGAPHRAGLSPVYNQYLRCEADPLYTADTEEVQALLRPLFMTAWLLDDFFADNACFGADTLLLSSASSKTAYATAWLMARRQAARVLGLTSPANRGFCERLGCYAQVLGYDALDSLPADTTLAYVDFAGNAGLRRRIHERFAQLRYSSSIGGTHLDALGGAKDLPGPRATLFFAPAQAQKRAADWGAAEMARRMGADWFAFIAATQRGDAAWLSVERHAGAAAVRAAYEALAAGRVSPQAGHMLRF